MTTKKRRKSTNTRRTHRRRGLQGISDIKLSPMLKDAQRPLAIAGGMVLGGLIVEKVLPKVFEVVSAGTQGLMGVKVSQSIYDAAKIGVPALIGLAGYQLAKYQIYRDLSIGCASYGAAKVVQQISAKMGLTVSGLGEDVTADDWLNNPPVEGFGNAIELPPLDSTPEVSGLRNQRGALQRAISKVRSYQPIS